MSDGSVSCRPVLPAEDRRAAAVVASRLADERLAKLALWWLRAPLERHFARSHLARGEGLTDDAVQVIVMLRPPRALRATRGAWWPYGGRKRPAAAVIGRSATAALLVFVALSPLLAAFVVASLGATAVTRRFSASVIPLVVLLLALVAVIAVGVVSCRQVIRLSRATPAGSYFLHEFARSRQAPPGAGLAFLADLGDVADRHSWTLSLQTHPPELVKHYGRAGFVETAHVRMPWGQDTYLMVRQPRPHTLRPRGATPSSVNG